MTYLFEKLTYESRRCNYWSRAQCNCLIPVVHLVLVVGTCGFFSNDVTLRDGVIDHLSIGLRMFVCGIPFINVVISQYTFSTSKRPVHHAKYMLCFRSSYSLPLKVNVVDSLYSKEILWAMPRNCDIGAFLSQPESWYVKT